MNATTDYFSLHGYRAMALAVIEQALVDLVQTRDPELSRTARDWIDFDPPKGAARQGLTFGDCIEAAGAASACELFRQRCRTEPNVLREDLRRLSSSLQCERKFVRNGSAQDAEYDALTALTTRDLPSTRVLHQMGGHAGAAYPS